MTFARPTSMNREPADLNAIIDRCVRLVQHQLKLRNIELHQELTADLPHVRCDSGQIEQVILALVMNAIDAMTNGGNLTLCSRKLANSGQVQVEVRDDGVGMPKDVLAKMFEPFFTTKEHGRGLGLGLAISRNIVDRHAGKIEVVVRARSWHHVHDYFAAAIQSRARRCAGRGLGEGVKVWQSKQICWSLTTS